MRKILLAAGDLNPAYSYEYQNFQMPLENLGCRVLPFDFLQELGTNDREGMNKSLLAKVRTESPDLVFFVPHEMEFIPEIVDEIGRITKTFCYFFDDPWRVEYSRFWARHYHYVTSSDVNGIQKFHDAGFDNVMFSPFACNHEVYKRTDTEKVYDVSFVGQYHPYREWLINGLKKRGIAVKTWGKGWASGMVSFDEMVQIFNQSRINLNFSNCVSWDARYLFSLSRPIKSTMRALRQGVRASFAKDIKTVEQVKGRHFEINACGGFQLSYYVEGLEQMYAIGKEIAIYVSPEDLFEKIQYFLKYPEIRESIAKAGHDRTLNDHTMEDRLQQILAKLELVSI